MKPLILVVDDDDWSRKLVCAFLTIHGFHAVDACDGEEGLAFTAGSRPDLVILDMQMPRLDGIATIKKLKERPDTAAIPIVMLSASAMERDKEKMRAAGCGAILTKPVNLAELLATIRKQLVGLAKGGGGSL